MDPVADYREYWKAQCLASGGQVEDGETIRMDTPIPMAYPIRGLLRYRGDTEGLRKELRAFLERGLPFAVSSDVPEHDPVIEEAGLRLNQDFAMVRAPVQDMGTPAHVVEWVDDASDFVTVQGVAHGIPPDGWDDLTTGWNACIAQGGMELAVVQDGDQPVGCGALFTGAGNAGLYAGSVLASHRRQGIAKSILQASMRRAQELGLTHAVGATTADGHAFTSALGFETVGRLRQYLWFPGPPPA